MNWGWICPKCDTRVPANEAQCQCGRHKSVGLPERWVDDAPADDDKPAEPDAQVLPLKPPATTQQEPDEQEPTQPRKTRHLKAVDRECEECGKRMSAKQNNKRFCGKPCERRARRARLKAREEFGFHDEENRQRQLSTIQDRLMEMDKELLRGVHTMVEELLEIDHTETFTQEEGTKNVSES